MPKFGDTHAGKPAPQHIANRDGTFPKPALSPESLVVQKNPTRKISMEGVHTGWYWWQGNLSAMSEMEFSAKKKTNPFFSLKQGLHLDVDANEKPNQVFLLWILSFRYEKTKQPCAKPPFVSGFAAVILVFNLTCPRRTNSLHLKHLNESGDLFPSQLCWQVPGCFQMLSWIDDF